ncbi:MAG: sodium-dependent transporter [Methanobrevibacter smithii]|jgi:NSS family neurotransmitter:Na+ symporter|uniref:Sodium:neurotransmitter symporter family protein n=2 Tax=Methanobrevibacter smithii TaxID=2173 RepID=D2ZQP0_METSM|nr:sodium-dependent transporter [Methanobrevibacter smithii]EFC93587.1 Sodium:neurotransmitter symporter family protein [Methanobrevibacter smithii DSM 2374]MBS6827370.1 sodium-dependent transporter [Methanobrevibacter smithii]MBT9658968.1 sodium-dependent transporter [Methanobrevibacter smithii]MEE0720272.1 sodium-dependent transporter [Methanobrevibacter smithii]HJJ02279.1 sodium-dependent transporter [Methanobrevibacter smithii]
MAKTKDKNEWGSNLSFLLAMIGSAVGLGNIWRYPYVLYSNGGGAFFIPYIVAILIMGIPFLILEYGVGYNFKSSFPKAVKSISKKWEYLGWFLPVAVFMILIYYSAILGWDGFYVIISAFKGWGADPNAYFTGSFLQANDTLGGLGTFVPFVAIAMLVGWVIMWVISHTDLEKGLGRVSKVLVPLLFAIMIFIVLFSLTLPGAGIGLAELYNPDWSLLLNFNIWMAAFGQMIFSLSLGMSIAFTYASYTKDDSDLVSNALWVTVANCGFENFAAIGVFSILGYMSLQSGVAVPDLVTQGTGLVFIVYPTVFNVLGDWASVIGPLFFFTVYLAGLTSILSTIEPLSFSIQNKFGWSRNKTMTILCVFGAAVSMIYATAMGSYILGIADTFVNQIAILIGVIFECIIFAWIFKAENIIPKLNAKSKSIKLGKWWLVVVKYVLPIFIAIVWVGGILEVISSGSMLELAILAILTIILLGATFIFTKLPAKSGEWDEVKQRL